MEKQWTVDEIISHFEQKAPISGALVLKWLDTDDLEILGVVYHYLNEQRYANRVTFQPPFEVIKPRIFDFLERCLIEDPVGEWCLTRYEAAREFARWFAWWWKAPFVSRPYLLEFKNRLARVCRENDEAVVVAVGTGALEHLFTKKKVVEFFSNWRDDPALRDVFTQAVRDARFFRLFPYRRPWGWFFR